VAQHPLHVHLKLRRLLQSHSCIHFRLIKFYVSKAFFKATLLSNFDNIRIDYFRTEGNSPLNDSFKLQTFALALLAKTAAALQYHAIFL